jgi:hypothetical protein
LVSQITQDRPLPEFLTDGGDYKQRNLAKNANKFIQGEFYRSKAYALGSLALRDSCAFGDGFLKVYPKHGKVHVERVLETELYTDYNDAYYGKPRQLVHAKLVDKSITADLYPKKTSIIVNAQKGNVDSTPRATETISDQFIAVELWHLPSGPDADDGRHVIVCSEGSLLDEAWKHDYFPFAKISYNPNIVGWFSQGLVEILMPTQMEIYRMLIVASQAIELMGVPRIYIDEMSKITETSFNNRIGTIIKGRGTAPQFLNATSNAPEIYQWIEFLISNAHNIAGISSMSASGVIQEQLQSGEAIREADKVQGGRFAALQQRYQDFYVDLSHKMMDCAADIAEDNNGSYKTTYVGDDGVDEIDFKSLNKLKKADEQFVIQCYVESSLPKDPAGRQAKLSEMLAAGEISNTEFRRLSTFPDLKQADMLANALEERILKCLDMIVEDGGKESFDFSKVAPDPYMLDPTFLGQTLVVNYINLYATRNLEEDKMQLLRNWSDLYNELVQQATPPPPPQAGPQSQLQTAPPQQSIGPASGVRV